MFFIGWLVLSVCIGVGASSRGRAGFGWFVFALICSPLVAFIALMAVGDMKPSQYTHIKCPQCAEWCLPEAKICKHCGSPLHKGNS